MKEFLRNIKNPFFQNKVYYIILQPVRLLSARQRKKVQDFAVKNWQKNPSFMHRLKWVCAEG
tara:strand:- start:979 stop:1164 length:186 start_codon:yes stop_codon:yes gene_type:complete